MSMLHRVIVMAALGFTVQFGIVACSGGGGQNSGMSGGQTTVVPPTSPVQPGATINGSPVKITEFPIAADETGPMSMTMGPDGNAWFLSASATAPFNGGVNRLTAAGTVTRFTSPDLYTPNDNTDITTGSDKALWFTTLCFAGADLCTIASKTLARATTAGSITLTGLRVSDTFHAADWPAILTLGPGGNVWGIGARAADLDHQGGVIFAVTPTAKFAVYEDLPLNCPSDPFPPDFYIFQGLGIAKGSDDAIYVPALGGDSQVPSCPQNVVFRFSASGKLLNTFVSPRVTDHSTPIAAGPDGNLWIAVDGTNTISNTILRMTKSGVFTSYAVPGPVRGFTRIIAGDDGAMWFTEANVSKIGRITTNGVFTEYPTPTANAQPYGIASLPGDCPTGHGRIWFTEANANKVGILTF